MATMQDGQVAGAAAPRKHTDSRFIGDLLGCYILGGTTKVYACRSRSVSAEHAVIDAPVMGEPEQKVTVRFDHLGLLKGHVADERSDGFSIVFDMSDDQRMRLAARIDWMKRYSLKTTVDRREHKRILPRNPHARMLVGGQKPMNCLVIDVSQSGAALSAALTPELGTPLALGTLLSKVVRHFESGFAVQFAHLQDLERIEEHMAVTTPEEKARALREVWPALMAVQGQAAVS
jgi:hypothetical protein